MSDKKTTANTVSGSQVELVKHPDINGKIIHYVMIKTGEKRTAFSITEKKFNELYQQMNGTQNEKA